MDLDTITPGQSAIVSVVAVTFGLPALFFLLKHTFKDIVDSVKAIAIKVDLTVDRLNKHDTDITVLRSEFSALKERLREMEEAEHKTRSIVQDLVGKYELIKYQLGDDRRKT